MYLMKHVKNENIPRALRTGKRSPRIGDDNCSRLHWISLGFYNIIPQFGAQYQDFETAAVSHPCENIHMN